MLSTVYCDASSVNERHNFDHVSRCPLKTERTDKWRNTPLITPTVGDRAGYTLVYRRRGRRLTTVWASDSKHINSCWVV
jgi:hypothetical protein